MRYLRVKNFERFQHYKGKFEDAAPTWIKLYRTLLVDYDFQKLTDTAKGHLMLIWLFASQTKGRIPDDSKWLADKIGATSKIDLAALIDAGFLTLESNTETTLECFSDLGEKDSIREERRGEEIRGEKIDPSDLVQPELDAKVEPSDLQEGWNDLCVPLGLSKVENLSPTRLQKCRLRLREHPEVAWWNHCLAQIRRSKFLLGMTNGNGNGAHRNWRLTFDWLIENDTNCVKIYEGQYGEEAKR